MPPGVGDDVLVDLDEPDWETELGLGVAPGGTGDAVPGRIVCDVAGLVSLSAFWYQAFDGRSVMFYPTEHAVTVVGVDAGNVLVYDPIRGAGTFERILGGIRNLSAAGLNPVITVTEACDGAASARGRERFLSWMREVGLARPRLKVLSLFRIGAEERRPDLRR